VNAADAGTLVLGGDVTVNRLGFGAMRITGPGIWGEPSDRATCRAVLRRAVELGVNLIDTADSYGPEVSEEIIAEALHPYPDDLVIATKGGFLRPGPGDWRADCRPEHLKEACEGSLRRLKLERIDVYQLHTVDGKVPYEDSIGALKELQAEGMIRHIGVSNVNLDQLATARSIVDVVSVQNRYNLTDRFSEEVLGACEEDRLGFLPWRPVAIGNPPEELERIAAARGATPSQVGLAWLLQRSPVMLPIPGTSSLEHLEENVAAAAIELSEDDLSALSRIRS
jgi:aryl-alcohol dehydrogenase-like predicted oxidoreductase